MDRKELELRKLKYVEMFQDCRWNWWGFLYVRGRHSRRHAIRQFEAWLDDLQREEGGKRFRWVRVFERGAGGEPHRFHILIGGLRSRARTWEKRWSKRRRDSSLQHLSEHPKDTIYSIVDCMDEDGKLDISYHLW